MEQQKQWTGNQYDCMTIEEYNDSIRSHVEKHKRLSKDGPRMELLGDGKIKAVENDFGNYVTSPSGFLIPS